MFGKSNINTDISLQPKNGHKHILLIHTGLQSGNTPEKKYTEKINRILEDMQNKGYEVLDVKLEIGGTYGLTDETLITYK